MGTINIYNDENNTTYQVNVVLASGYLTPEPTGGGTGEYDIWLKITTTIPQSDGSSFGAYVVRTLDDVAPGASAPAADFKALIQGYIDYFMTEAELTYSSSSSSSTSSSSSSYIENWSSSSSTSSSYIENWSSSSSSSSSGV